MRLKYGVQKITLTVIFVLLLTSCTGDSITPETKVQEMRQLYRAVDSVSAEAEITADYGERTYTYTVSLEGDANSGALTVKTPENIAGMTLNWDDGETTLSTGDITLETGALTASGLSPADAVPAVLSACRAGNLVECSLEEDGQILYTELENPDVENCTVSCWFSAENYSLLRAELAEGGQRVITLELTDFEFYLSEKGEEAD